MNRILLFFLIFLSFTFVEVKAQRINSKTIKKLIENSKEQENSFTGFALYDLQTKKMVAEYNSNKYFIPASNTKLFTFYAGMKILGDTLPGLKYYIDDNVLYFTGTGDPSFLNFDIEVENPVYDFLKNRKETLCYLEGFYTSLHFGYGWAWDDYNYYYSPERSNFPLYGNIIRFKAKKDGTYSFLPKYFKHDIKINTQTEKKYSKVVRKKDENKFEYFAKPYKKIEQDIPFKTSTELMIKLLQDTLKRKIYYAETTPQHMKKLQKAKTLKSIPADSLYKQMLRVSDNFMAEQILLMCSSVLNDSLSTDFTINYVLENLLPNLPDECRWVDGSGLSRYNLFSPRDYVHLLQKIWLERSQEQLFDMLPAGGKTGTLKYWYKADKPYVFAKTGTLSNNHNLSGFLKTKKGKVLIFSFMNNHYMGSSSTVKKMMSRILKKIYLEY